MPTLVLFAYAFVGVGYALKGIAAFGFQFGIPVAFLATGITTCVFIYPYGMNLARERGEI